MEKIRAQEKYWKDMIVKHINPLIYGSPYNSVRKTNMNVFPETQNKWESLGIKEMPTEIRNGFTLSSGDVQRWYRVHPRECVLMD